MTKPELAVAARHISKSFFGDSVLDNVSINIRRGEIHALLGENGAGKSVLCSILAGLYRADSGQIRIAGAGVDLRNPSQALELGVGMVYQDFRLVNDLTVAENIVLGDPRLPRRVSWKRVHKRVAESAESFGIAVDTYARIRDLSVGERQRIEILKLLYRDVQVLILDEPTGVLTPQEVHELFATLRLLRDTGRSIVLISHKISELREVAERVTVLRNGKRVGTTQLASVDDSELARMMVGSEIPASRAVSAVSASREHPVLVVDGLSVRGNDGRTAVKGFSLVAHGSELVGIAGVAGNGQLELTEALAGLRRVAAGTVQLQDAAADPGAFVDITQAPVQERIELGVAHIPQDRRQVGIAPSLTVGTNLSLKTFRRAPLSHRGILSRSAQQRYESELRASYDIRGGFRKLPASILSGGNIQKLILARELSRQPRLVIASYPTRGLDLGAVANVRGVLVDQLSTGCSIVLVSEDLDELFALSHRLLVMHDGTLMGEYRRGEFDRETIGALMAGHQPSTRGSG